jgi:DNA helicase-2/ATP-dependent DNA helicase PcrA
MDEGSLPHSRSVDQPDQLEEERRLAYVGITRAMQRLYLVRARMRSIFGDTQPTIPSRFLDDIPQHLITRKGMVSDGPAAGSTRPVQQRVSSWEDDINQDPYGGGGHVFGRGTPSRGTTPTWNPPSRSTSVPRVPPSIPPKTPRAPKVEATGELHFHPGDRVRHNIFGKGIVLKSELEETTEFVEVQFEGVGKKRLSMDFARLDKLEM